MMELSLLSSPHEFHFVHAGLPHARHKRSVPHSRKLKTDPQVRPMIMRRVIIIMVRMRIVAIVIATTCLMLDCQGNEERMRINFSVCHFTVGSFCVLWITSNNCKMEPFMSKRLQSSSIWEECWCAGGNEVLHQNFDFSTMFSTGGNLVCFVKGELQSRDLKDYLQKEANTCIRISRQQLLFGNPPPICSHHNIPPVRIILLVCFSKVRGIAFILCGSTSRGGANKK